MSLMDPNVDPMLKFVALKELAKLHAITQHSKVQRPEKAPLKKRLIVAIRKFGHLLVDLGYRLERFGYPETPVKY